MRDLDTYLTALAARDSHPNPDVRALTDAAVLAAIDRHQSQTSRPARGRPPSHPDPTGEQATARANQQQKRRKR